MPNMMDFIKSKLTIRNLLLALSFVITLVGFIMHLVVCTTGYFVGQAPNAVVTVCSILFLVGTVLFIAFDDKIGKFDTLVFFALAAFIILSFVFFVLDKEAVVGEMMVPVNHPQKQIDAASLTITGVVFYGVGFIFFAAASFFALKGAKKEKVSA